MPYRKKKHPLRGIGVSVGAMCPIRPNVVWAMDFQFDQTSDGRMLKLLNVIDEYTRECLAIVVERSIDADGVVACLEQITAVRGAPAYVRFYNGPRVHRLRGGRLVPLQRDRDRLYRSRLALAKRLGGIVYGRLRDEHLNGQRFDSLLEAKVFTEDWRIDYNMNRPHSAHGWLTPVEFVEAWLNQQQLTLA